MAGRNTEVKIYTHLVKLRTLFTAFIECQNKTQMVLTYLE